MNDEGTDTGNRQIITQEGQRNASQKRKARETNLAAQPDRPVSGQMLRLHLKPFLVST